MSDDSVETQHIRLEPPNQPLSPPPHLSTPSSAKTSNRFSVLSQYSAVVEQATQVTLKKPEDAPIVWGDELRHRKLPSQVFSDNSDASGGSRRSSGSGNPRLYTSAAPLEPQFVSEHEDIRSIHPVVTNQSATISELMKNDATTAPQNLPQFNPQNPIVASTDSFGFSGSSVRDFHTAPLAPPAPPAPPSPPKSSRSSHIDLYSNDSLENFISELNAADESKRRSIPARKRRSEISGSPSASASASVPPRSPLRPPSLPAEFGTIRPEEVRHSAFSSNASYYSVSSPESLGGVGPSEEPERVEGFVPPLSIATDIAGFVPKMSIAGTPIPETPQSTTSSKYTETVNVAQSGNSNSEHKTEAEAEAEAETETEAEAGVCGGTSGSARVSVEPPLRHSTSRQAPTTPQQPQKHKHKQKQKLGGAPFTYAQLSRLVDLQADAHGAAKADLSEAVGSVSGVSGAVSGANTGLGINSTTNSTQTPKDGTEELLENLLADDFAELDFGARDKLLIDKIVTSLSRVTLEMSFDEAKRVEGQRRLANALRALEGWI